MKARFFLPILLVSALAWGQELPVTRVVLFTSGVGFFEHSATVTGNAEVSLSFTESQINDVLKSLILRDEGGNVGMVGYPSQDPLDRTLSSFALDLGGPGGLAALLPQLRGANLTLTTPTEVTGKLVGLDQRPQADRTETWLTLATAEGLRVISLNTVSQVRLLDPQLDQELSQALAVLAASRDTRKKTVTARFEGQGTRRVSAGYIAEAPVWKTSYRLDLSGTKPYLQAWAIVENTSEADWNRVRLSLVSGRPVSFIQDLYSPLYVQRPLYEPETEAGPSPRLPQAALSAPAPAAQPMAKSLSREMLYDEASAPFEESKMELRGSGFRAATGGASAGELFQFSLQAPLTLARHRSALIPLAATDIQAQKVSLFNAEVDSIHPQNAVWITNTSGLRLPGGPVTVYDGGTYGGDAITDTLLEKDRRLWVYATDLAVRTDLSSTDGQTTSKISVLKGVLQSKKDLTWTRSYRFVNIAAEAKTVLVEHPNKAERTLLSPVATEKTPDTYRFSVAVPARGEATLLVKESRTVLETQGLAGWRAEQLLTLVQSSGPLGTEVKAALQKAAELKAKAERATQESASLAQQIGEQETGQGRIRENLEAVGRESAQGLVYLKRLMDAEAKIDQLTQQRDVARQAQTVAQKDLDDYLKNLTLE